MSSKRLTSRMDTPPAHHRAPVRLLLDAVGVVRKCLCNALLSTIGLGQRREDGVVEPPLITSGDDLARLSEFLNGRTRYSAADAVRWLLGGSAGDLRTP